MNLRTMLLLGILATCHTLTAADDADSNDKNFVPFVIPSEVSDKSLIAFKAAPVPADAARVEARDGHFWLGKNRWRAWGVNFCFGANFPTHADAQKIARRLEAFGVNATRHHHMDSQAFPDGIWDPKDRLKLSDEALDRLDYFLDQLARHGIRANINLHVSRGHAKALKLPDADKAPGMDKIIDIFTPELIDAQKKYARDLLTHTNAHRKVRYADDPAVAFVEINNEDSLFMWGADNTIQSLPPHYAKILESKFNAWLKARYGTGEKLTAAWSAGAAPLGENMIAGVAKRQAQGNKGVWFLEQHEGCQAKAADLPKAGEVKSEGVRIDIAKANQTTWHIQFSLNSIKLTAGSYYTFIFKARADKPRQITASAGQAHDPWKGLGLSRTVSLSDRWKPFRCGFTASDSDDNARVGFVLGGSDTAVEIADVELRPGGIEGLAKDESIDKANVALYGQAESPARTTDRMRFFAETEKAYFDDMRQFIKKDLGCKSLVTGTIVFGPLGLWTQSDMDYIDGHAYWQHPHFPGRPWDGANWLVEQKAMVDHPDQSPLFRLACERLAGKPYTVSEYNHPAPNDYQAECVPMIASFAAAQDWDGVWLFAYSHSRDSTTTDRFSSFFDIVGNPAKWGFMPAGTIIFREGGFEPFSGKVEVSLSQGEDPLASLAKLQAKHGMDMLGAAAAFDKRMSTLTCQNCRALVSLNGQSSSTRPLTEARSGWNWSMSQVHFVLAVSTQAMMVDGYLLGGGTRDHFGAFTATAMDGLSLKKSKKILLTICERCENTDMVFSEDRRTVGTRWGKAPVRIGATTDEIRVPPWGEVDLSAKWQCQALNPDGTANGKVDLKRQDSELLVLTSAKYKTMWYLLTRE
ncbi:MAG: carbohydrate binding domain-containing protein [Phycisphaerae bacterium]